MGNLQDAPMALWLGMETRFFCRLNHWTRSIGSCLISIFLRHNCVTCHIFLPKLFEIGRFSLIGNPTVFGSRTGLHCKKPTPCSGKPDIQGTGVDHTWISGLRRPDFEGINIHDFDVTIRVCFDGLLSDRNCEEKAMVQVAGLSRTSGTTLFDHMTYATSYTRNKSIPWDMQFMNSITDTNDDTVN